jgi:L-cysteine:1D-myo-inositol 2-amino-2-deoxy-alpha-D-glucopyranoside ligase
MGGQVPGPAQDYPLKGKMNLYDSLSQTLRPLQPEENHVKVYVCGITPYDTTHLGHAFTYTTFDILIRFLEGQGYRVTYVQNVTDIDDDILRKAGQTGENWRSLGNRWTVHFIEDLQALNVRPPDYYPRATDNIAEINELIEDLLAAGKAYQAGGNVYYHVDAWSEFGKLSHLPRPEMLPVANERGNNPKDPHKRDPLDFVLWQARAPGEPAWDSPWGPGRPGWHIECSAMSTRFLGNTLDIHSGGGDLIFPHHECEIAQVEPVTGHVFVRTWMHVAMVRHQGEKMSKSLGNLVMIRDLLKTWSPDAIRLYLGMHHYRDSWSFNEAELEQAGEVAQALHAAATVAGGAGPALDGEARRREFIACMESDLDTPGALSVLTGLAGEILTGAREDQDVSEAQVSLRLLAGVFGLRLDAAGPEPQVIEGWDQHKLRFVE